MQWANGVYANAKRNAEHDAKFRRETIERNKSRAAPAGTERMNEKGRIKVKVVNHPEFGTGWVLRSHLVYWRRTKICVKKGYVIHHCDDDKTNDTFWNLELMTGSRHSKIHRNFGMTPWNKGKRGLQKRPDLAELNRQPWTAERRVKHAVTMARAIKKRPRDPKGRLMPKPK